MKTRNLLEKIPLEPAEIEEFKQHVHEDLNKCFKELKEVDAPICHILPRLYQEEPTFKVLIDNYTQIYDDVIWRL